MVWFFSASFATLFQKLSFVLTLVSSSLSYAASFPLSFNVSLYHYHSRPLSLFLFIFITLSIPPSLSHLSLLSFNVLLSTPFSISRLSLSLSLSSATFDFHNHNVINKLFVKLAFARAEISEQATVEYQQKLFI